MGCCAVLGWGVGAWRYGISWRSGGDSYRMRLPGDLAVFLCWYAILCLRPLNRSAGTLVPSVAAVRLTGDSSPPPLNRWDVALFLVGELVLGATGSHGGAGGIRTPGTFRHTRFPIVHLQPTRSPLPRVIARRPDTLKRPLPLLPSGPGGLTGSSHRDRAISICMAEREGFEPPVPFGTLDFESSAFNRTRPSLRFQGKPLAQARRNDKVWDSAECLQNAGNVPSLRGTADALQASSLRPQAQREGTCPISSLRESIDPQILEALWGRNTSFEHFRTP